MVFHKPAKDGWCQQVFPRQPECWTLEDINLLAESRMTSMTATPADSARTPSRLRMNAPTPAELATLARLGDCAAFGQIVLLYQDRLFNSLLRLVGNADEAAELTRQTLSRALARITELTSDSPYLWLFGIGCKLALASLHQTRRNRRFQLDPASDSHQPVLTALGRLEGEYRAVLVMREVENFNYQQISEVLSLPTATVKSRLFRARLALRDELQGSC
jgi:RNA polymerase sigma-70 factor (ECF subfamily)